MFVNIPATKPLALLHLLSSTLFLLKSDVLIMEVIPKYKRYTDTIKLLRTRGDAMQNAVPKGEGGMLAILGSSVEMIEKILKDNQNNLRKSK